MKKRIKEIFEDSIKTKQATLEKNTELVIKTVNVINKAFKKDRKLFFFGNGGSAADSQHIAAEFIGRFQKERRALPAIALTTDSSILTCLGNDYGFDIIFSRQLQGLAQKGDVAIGISTSGNSPNVLLGIKQANKMGLTTVSLTGGTGGKIAKQSDISLIVPSKVTARIQESHICLAHTICELVEDSI